MAIRYSNSKLNTVINDPMDYYLAYEQGIGLKEKPTALALGSAVHYGLEIGSCDLDEYFKENGNFQQRTTYSNEQLLAECMVNGFFKNKEGIFEKILTYNDKKLELIEEYHELELTANMPNTEDTFFGIIDLLLLTNEGFILLDYKTSSQTPNWDAYIEQIYRYIFLLRANFPEVPILKIGIINLRKIMARQKKNENENEFKNRIKWEYETNSEEYINYHEYLPKELDENLLNNYINNLYIMCKSASKMIEDKNWYINYSNANGVYKSQYWELYYGIKDAYILYNIKDKYYDETTDSIIETRDCNETDMKVIDTNLNIINHYEKFEEIKKDCKSMDEIKFINYLKNKNYMFDENLIKNYFKVYELQNK